MVYSDLDFKRGSPPSLVDFSTKDPEDLLPNGEVLRLSLGNSWLWTPISSHFSVTD